MALQELTFSFTPPAEGRVALPEAWSHTGVVGSGDMEVLLRRRPQEGRVTALIVTPVRGYDHVWEKVLARFVEETRLSDAHIEINDNNATPYIVATRLRQALAEAMAAPGAGAQEGGEA